MRKSRPRLRSFDYTGLNRIFLTFCTNERLPHFADGARVQLVLGEILRTASPEGVAIPVYCFMPDHLHLLVEGTREDTDIRRFVHQAKQRSGYEFSRSYGGRLWQPSWYDHVLRDEEATPGVIRYILENPIRAGLARSFQEYPFWGSQLYKAEELAEFMMDDEYRWRP
jgi:putative transposase